MEITGGCLCRAVRYSISAAPIVTRTCWCRVCQYIGAGSATVNTCFASEALTVSGELRKLSSDRGQRQRGAPALLCGLRNASFQRLGGAAAPDLRARRYARRPRACQTQRDDLDLERAQLGVL